MRGKGSLNKGYSNSPITAQNPFLRRGVTISFYLGNPADKKLLEELEAYCRRKHGVPRGTVVKQALRFFLDFEK